MPVDTTLAGRTFPATEPVTVSREKVLEFARATLPLRAALRELAAADVPNIDPQLAPYFRDVADHAVRVGDQIEGFGGSAKRSIGSKLLASQLEAMFERARAAAP